MLIRSPFGLSGNESRQDARVPSNARAEQLQREMDDLIREKKQIEQSLAEVEHWKRDQLAEIYSKKYPKSTACDRTNAMEVERHRRRAPLLAQLYAIEERRHQISGRLKDSNQSHHEIREAEVSGLLRQILDVLREMRDGAMPP